ncbi:hypothetical protein [Methylobacterium sp. CCH5-D2]|uniref:hypothetical protein n=1 Tax=Methylobacterium sp. CCH5-D2 TaxID=1768765 RepID=UPI000835A468|nr:hypothetical protein [Methylobacterium sp. CCH5-D2]
MTGRRPLVQVGGDTGELPKADTLIGNATFTAPASALPLLTALGATTITLAVTPKASGDSLQPGEVLVATPSAALPAGLNIAYAIATDVNTVVIGLSATLAVAAATRAWTIVALR